MNYTILVIDYEPRGIEQIRTPLEKAGFRVEVANNGDDGIAAFEKLDPMITFVEIMLPGRSGLEVCRQLKRTPHGANAPIVLMTSRFRRRKYRGEAITNHFGAAGCLEKPIEADAVIALVKELGQAEAVAAPAAEASAEQRIENELGSHLDSVLSSSSNTPRT